MSEFKRILTTYERMCNNYHGCRNCPVEALRKKLCRESTISCFSFACLYPDQIEEVIIKWGDRHPIRTVREVFFKKFPTAPFDNYGNPYVCPEKIGLVHCPYTEGQEKDCRKCWDNPAIL